MQDFLNQNITVLPSMYKFGQPSRCTQSNQTYTEKTKNQKSLGEARS